MAGHVFPSSRATSHVLTPGPSRTTPAAPGRGPARGQRPCPPQTLCRAVLGWQTHGRTPLGLTLQEVYRRSLAPSGGGEPDAIVNRTWLMTPRCRDVAVTKGTRATLACV